MTNDSLRFQLARPVIIFSIPSVYTGITYKAFRISFMLRLYSGAIIVFSVLFLASCASGGGGGNAGSSSAPSNWSGEELPEKRALVSPYSYSSTSQSDMMGSDYWRDQGFSGAGVKVQVLDTGIGDADQDNFDYIYNGSLNSRYTTINGSLVKVDDDRRSTGDHGEYVANIIGHYDWGIASNAEIYHSVIADSSGYTDRESLLMGLKQSLDNQVDIANISFQYGGLIFAKNATNHLTQAEIDLRNIKHQAINQDIVIIHSAGNNNEVLTDEIFENEFFYDAILSDLADQMIIVGATFDGKDHTLWSGRPGTNATIQARFLLAPAESEVGDTLIVGTSFSAANVSGAMALMKERWSHLGGRELTQILLDTADKSSTEYTPETHGMGVIDIVSAFNPIGSTSYSANGKTYPLSHSTIVLPAAFNSVSFDTVVIDQYRRDYAIQLNTLPSAQKPLDFAQLVDQPQRQLGWAYEQTYIDSAFPTHLNFDKSSVESIRFTQKEVSYQLYVNEHTQGLRHSHSQTLFGLKLETDFSLARSSLSPIPTVQDTEFHSINVKLHPISTGYIVMGISHEKQQGVGILNELTLTSQTMGAGLQHHWKDLRIFGELLQNTRELTLKTQFDRYYHGQILNTVSNTYQQSLQTHNIKAGVSYGSSVAQIGRYNEHRYVYLGLNTQF